LRPGFFPIETWCAAAGFAGTNASSCFLLSAVPGVDVLESPYRPAGHLGLCL
jgi:hypothetical protein